MSTLHSLTTELATLATRVRQELASIKDSADTTGLSTVMGRFCRDAAKQTPLELSRTIQEDSVFMRSLGDMEDSDKKEVARHVRRLMDSYAEKVADGTYATMLTEFDARCATPTHVKAVCAEKSLESFIAKMFGMYTVQIDKFESIHVMVMQNTKPNIEGTELHYVFDMKGSSINREVLKRKSASELKDPTGGKVLKDLDYVRLKELKNFFTLEKIQADPILT